MGYIWNGLIWFYQEYHAFFNIILIIVGALLINWILRMVLMRTVTGVVHRVKRGHNIDQTQEISIGPYQSARAIQRTRTLGTFGANVISWLIVLSSIFLALLQFNVSVTTIISSLGFVAAGLAFGAQNIVKDVLNGLFMVMEDQYGVGDLITVGTISGTVENVGLRVTQVRALDGKLWYVRNGEVLTLGNASQGWGQAVIDITVSTDSDLSQVEEEALACAYEMMQSPEFSSRVTGNPKMLGLESVYGDRATFRLTIRTRPEAQFPVQREIRARIAERFETKGITLADELPKQAGGSL